MDPQSRNVDARIARIATRANGIVTRAELRAARISGEEIKVRIRRGTLIREYRGVYRVGHAAPSIEAGYMAAMKAFNGIPTTTVARTLVDIAGRLAEDELARACHEAQVKYRTTPNQVEGVLRHRPEETLTSP